MERQNRPIAGDQKRLELLSKLADAFAWFCGLGALVPILALSASVHPESGVLGDSAEGGGLGKVIGLALLVLALLAYAVCLDIAARALARRRRYKFCLAMGVVSGFVVPLGTILGLSIIKALEQPGVKESFAAAEG